MKGAWPRTVAGAVLVACVVMGWAALHDIVAGEPDLSLEVFVLGLSVVVGSKAACRALRSAPGLNAGAACGPRRVRKGVR